MTARRADRPGYVLIAVLVVVVVLSYASYRYLDSMSTEFTLAMRDTEQVQVRAYAISGVHFAAGALADQTYLEDTLGGVYEDNAVFQNATAGSGEGPRGGGRFALPNVRGLGDGTYALTYGAADESGKINLNAIMLTDPTGQALYNALMMLPNMTEDVADAIVDWVDVDEDPRAAGAEAGDYSNYRPKNGPVNTLDELLLVRGVTPELLYGSDRNRNGVADPSEAAGGTLSQGWSEFLTCYGREPNVDSTGTKRIDLTSDDLSTVYEQLLPAVPQELADYLIAYRAFTMSAVGSGSAPTVVSTVTVSGGGSRSMTTVTSSGGGGSQSVTASAEQVTSAVQLALSTGLATSKRKPKSLFDLVNTQITLPRAPGQPANAPTLTFPSPLNNPEKLKEYLPILLDKTTATPGTELIPRININTAPREVLLAIPGMTEELVEDVLSTRSGLDPLDPATKTAAWLVTELDMPAATFNTMSRYVTGTTQTYRVQSIGYFANGGPTARVEAVIDTNQGKPRIVFYRDLTELGRGFEPPR
jgi:type II secretory pathway component PulK